MFPSIVVLLKTTISIYCISAKTYFMAVTEILIIGFWLEQCPHVLSCIQFVIYHPVSV